MLKKLYVVRHGEMSLEDLTLNGRGQMVRVATTLKNALVKEGAPQRVVLLSSSAPWAVQSARIIGDTLGLLVTTSPVLWSDLGQPISVEKAADFVQCFMDADIIVVVTHTWYAELLAPKIAQNLWKQRLEPFALGHGKISQLDFESRTPSIVRLD
jgi:broad specificity phosphatase PhoE